MSFYAPPVKSSTDANGWIKRNYGTFQQYDQNVVVSSQAVAANSNVQVAALNTPVGVADTSTLRIWCGIMGGFGGRIYATPDNGNTTSAVSSFTIHLGNSTTGSITFTGLVYVYAITT